VLCPRALVLVLASSASASRPPCPCRHHHRHPLTPLAVAVSSSRRRLPRPRHPAIPLFPSPPSPSSSTGGDGGMTAQHTQSHTLCCCSSRPHSLTTHPPPHLVLVHPRLSPTLSSLPLASRTCQHVHTPVPHAPSRPTLVSPLPPRFTYPRPPLDWGHHMLQDSERASTQTSCLYVHPCSLARSPSSPHSCTCRPRRAPALSGTCG
jgi:hypothetical protein